MDTIPSIYAFICTRSDKTSKTTERLIAYLLKSKVETHLLVNKDSIFSAYDEQLKVIIDNGANENDIVIMCHDDIEILNAHDSFVQILKESLNDPKIGITGVAGTTQLLWDGVWWNKEVWAQGGHRGIVFHGDNIWEMHPTIYGIFGKTVVVDGLFMASTVGVLQKIGLKKPETYKSNWDFYDLTLCMRAYEAGYINQVAPIFIRHESPGQMRPSWNETRKKFLALFHLPVKC